MLNVCCLCMSRKLQRRFCPLVWSVCSSVAPFLPDSSLVLQNTQAKPLFRMAHQREADLALYITKEANLQHEWLFQSQSCSPSWRESAPSSYPCSVPCMKAEGSSAFPHTFHFLFISLKQQPRAVQQSSPLLSGIEPTANMHLLLYFHGAQCVLETQLLSVAIRNPHLVKQAGSCFLPTLKSEKQDRERKRTKPFWVENASVLLLLFNEMHI